MFHACFIPIATCFASTLYHFYTFFGTNLLTRCRSASSCFLLFLYSRKASLEIFSELDETTWGSLFFQNSPDGAKEQQRRATRRPHAPRAQAPLLPRPSVAWPPGGSAPTPLWTPWSPRDIIDDVFCFVQFREYFLDRFSETKNSRKQGTGTVASC